MGAEMESSSFMSDDGAPQMQTHDDVRSAGKLLDDECLITAPTGRAAAILGKGMSFYVYLVSWRMWKI